MLRSFLLATLVGCLAAACSAPRSGAPLRDTEAYPPESVEAAHRPAPELHVEPLRDGPAIGGRIVFAVEGEPDEVLEMLLDFEHADGKRAWSTKHELVSRDGECAVARWHLKGNGTLQPTVNLSFVTEREEDRIRLTFELLERTFGVSELFGDYTIVSSDEGGSLLSGRVFVASGLPFGGPTPDDIHHGMRVDAELIRTWMHERLLAR